MLSTTTGMVGTSSNTLLVCGRHVVAAWRRARGSNQHRTRYEAICETCGIRVVRNGRRPTDTEEQER